MNPVVLVVLVPVAALLGLAGLTGVGQRRRGGGIGRCVAAGLFFPLAWIGWYVHDRPHLSG